MSTPQTRFGEEATTMSPVDSPDCNNVGVDLFSYYFRAVAELLAKDDDDDGENDNSRSTTGSVLFDGAIGARLSDVKRERLKSLLRLCVFVLTPQIDEMLQPVMKMHNLQLLLRSNKQQDTRSGATSDSDTVECPPKKLRRSSPASQASVSAHESPVRDEPNGEVDDYLQFLLKKDSSKVEALLKKYYDELSATLENMRQRLEEILNTVMSKCRLMTSSEKEQLRRRVLKLPQDNLRRATEIIGHKEGSETESHHDDIALWRLYYYVEALQKAENLDADADITRSSSLDVQDGD